MQQEPLYIPQTKRLLLPEAVLWESWANHHPTLVYYQGCLLHCLLHYLICKTPEMLGSLINVVNFETVVRSEVRPFSEVKTRKFNTYYCMAAIILAYDKIW